MTSILPTTYLPPISYLRKCMQSEKIIIDQYEHFIKQTFRSRCNIYGPNGLQRLVIPVIHKNLFRTPMKDVRISFDSPWNMIHWKSICSAYRNSPFFEYYEEDFQKIFHRPSEFLFEFNHDLLQLIFRIFKIKTDVSFAHSYEKIYVGMEDLRNSFDPGQVIEKIEPYHQVFSDRHGFISDLSCIDLLFNAGV